MSKPKGGRGIKAPYETTHARVPENLKPLVDDLVAIYRDRVIAGTLNPDTSITEYSLLVPSLPLEQTKALQKAESVLRQKKSARVSCEKLLTAIYNVEISL